MPSESYKVKITITVKFCINKNKKKVQLFHCQYSRCEKVAHIIPVYLKEKITFKFSSSTL